MTKLYIAYGSLNKHAMRVRCPHARPLGKLMLTKARLVFRGVADQGQGHTGGKLDFQYVLTQPAYQGVSKMQLVTNTPPWFSPNDMKLFRRAFRFAERQLGLDKNPEPIHINFMARMPKNMGNACVEGTTRNPFLMMMSKMSVATTIYALFHELTHVKQFVHGDMVNHPKGWWICWKGKYFDSDFLPELGKGPANESNPEYCKYRALPWEAEAHAMQDQLAAEFMKYLGG